MLDGNLRRSTRLAIHPVELVKALYGFTEAIVG